MSANYKKLYLICLNSNVVLGVAGTKTYARTIMDKMRTADRRNSGCNRFSRISVEDYNFKNFWSLKEVPLTIEGR
jgi:ATP-dependent protease HslVU (ClpYQ) peptidase subunit